MSPQDDDGITAAEDTTTAFTAPGTEAAGTVPDPAAAEAPDELRSQIAETRGELGDTVEALTHKLDVKGRAKDGIEERTQAAKDGAKAARESAHDAADRTATAVQERKLPVSAAVAVAGLVVVVVIWRRRSR